MSERQAEIDRILKILVKLRLIIPVVDKNKIARELVDKGIRSKDGFEVDCTKRDGFDNWVGIQPKQYKDDERTIESEG